MAMRQFQISGSPAALQWQKDLETMRNTEQDDAQMIEALDAVVP